MINTDRQPGAVFVTRSESETAVLGKAFAGWLKANAGKGKPAVYVSLNGEMGGGKTAFVKGVMLGLGYTGRVTSPTFALCNRYDCGLTVYHADLYRLAGSDDIFSAGLLDLDDGDIVLVEWAGIARELMKFDVDIGFGYGEGENCRILSFPAGILPQDILKERKSND